MHPAFSSSLYAAEISSSRWSIPEVALSRDADILQPRADRTSAGIRREIPRRPGAEQCGRPRRLDWDPLFRSRVSEKANRPIPARQDETNGGDLRRRNFINTVLTAIRYSQVENAESPRNELTLRNTCKKRFLSQVFRISDIFVSSAGKPNTHASYATGRVSQKPARRRARARCTRLASDSVRGF